MSLQDDAFDRKPEGKAISPDDTTPPTTEGRIEAAAAVAAEGVLQGQPYTPGFTISMTVIMRLGGSSLGLTLLSIPSVAT